MITTVYEIGRGLALGCQKFSVGKKKKKFCEQKGLREIRNVFYSKNGKENRNYARV
jgi:hypothetical protein